MSQIYLKTVPYQVVMLVQWTKDQLQTVKLRRKNKKKTITGK